MFRVKRDAFDRAHLHALGLLKMAHAFGAPPGINDVEVRAHGNGLVGALGLADIAIDAGIGDHQGHQDSRT
jgi:hypothetical protein